MKAFLVQASSQWQESIAPLRKRWLQLDSREQMVVLALAILLAVVFLVFAVWMPSHKGAEKARAEYESNRQTLLWIQANADQVRSSSAGSGGSVLGDVNSSAGSNGLVLSRVEPEGDATVRVWIEQADFNKVAAWLSQLKSQGVSIGEAQIEKKETGGVSGRFTLSR